MMVAKVCLLLVIASTSSARHLFEADRYLVQPLNPESDTNHNDQIVQRRNIDYSTGTSTNAHENLDKFVSYDQGSQHHGPDGVKQNDFDSETATRKMNIILPLYEGPLKTNVNQNAHRLNGNNRADASKTEAKTNRPMKMDEEEQNLYSMTQNEDQKEEDVPWVWGSDPKEANTQADPEGMDLTDRTAFVVDKCAKGYVKINGTCVEEH